jgi:lauroyl/myristoyl acyltransferase
MRLKRRLKRLKRIVRRPFEWLGIFLALAFFAVLPRRAMLAVCDFASAVMYAFDGKGRAIARANLGIMFGSRLSERRMRLIMRRSYRNMARSVGHAFWTSVFARSRAAAASEADARCSELLAAHKCMITVSGHIGCWEILSQIAFLHGHRMMSVAKDIGTPAMTRLLMWSRRSIGQSIVPAQGAFKPLMAGVRDGMSLGLLVDQVVRPSDGGMWVRFFGRPHPVSSAPAFFSAKAKVPIGIAWSRPLKDGRYRCEYVDEIPCEEARDIWRTTQRCIAGLERVIRRHPSCWALNYNCFRKSPNADELAKLEEREGQWTAR